MDTADSDLPDAAVEHISQMLTLAKCKHQEAMALLGTPDPNALPRLREVLRLLEEVELLADDATSYVEADVMKTGHCQRDCTASGGRSRWLECGHASPSQTR